VWAHWPGSSGGAFGNLDHSRRNDTRKSAWF
jgi:hypothetical protein